MFILSDKEIELSIYNQMTDPLTSNAVGNSDIGLLFGQRVKPNMVWQLRYDGKSDLILEDENNLSTVIGNFEGVKSLTFVFDNFSYPIVATETMVGISIYKFKNYANETNSYELINSFENCRNPKLVPGNVGDLGSVLNQPFLFYIDENNTLTQRTLKDNFSTIVETITTKILEPTDILEKASITQNGKIQLSISKLKIES